MEPVGAHGGMDGYDIFLLDALRSVGVDATLFTSTVAQQAGGTLGRRIHLPFKHVFSPRASLTRGLHFLLAAALATAKARLGANRIAHFHLFQFGALQLYSIAIARSLGLRVVITVHDVETLAGRLSVGWIRRWVLAMAHDLIVHSQVAERELRMQDGSRGTRIAMVPHGNVLASSVTQINREEARIRLGIPFTQPVLLFFGHIKTVKGLDVLLSAMPEVLRHHPAVRLVIAGKPSRCHFAQYETMIDALGVRQACDLRIRHIPNDEADALYSAADLVVLPYRRIYQSGVLLSAMARRTATVASNIEGMREVIQDGVNGWLFSSGDPTSLAAVVNAALASPQSRKRVVEEAVRYLDRSHAPEVVGRATLACYRAALSPTHHWPPYND